MATNCLDYMLNTRPAVSYLRQVRKRPATAKEAKWFAKKDDKHAGDHGQRIMQQRKEATNASRRCMNTKIPETLVHPSVTAKQVTYEVLRPMFRAPNAWWWMGLGLSVAMFSLLVVAMAVQMLEGIGILGINNPVFWGTYITNFVFWIGIGHAGTLISAVLFLFRQPWRMAINRSGRGDDDFCRVLCRYFPADAHRSAVGRFLAVPLSELSRSIVATVPQSADVGRLCDFDLCNDIGVVLVPRVDS